MIVLTSAVPSKRLPASVVDWARAHEARRLARLDS
jgi:hypothetical protein